MTRTLQRGLVLLIGLLCAGCAAEKGEVSRSAPRKVALIGWDGATWDVIDPLLRRGELPAVERLLARGSRGVLLARPPMLSPALWTTLATGFSPAEHGITDFQLPDPAGGSPVLASTLHRTRAPLWKIASAGGRTVGFVGWWTSWPAEPVSGYLVSDHLAYNRWDAWARRPRGESYHLTYPTELADELGPVAVRPELVAPQTLLDIAAFNAREQREMIEALQPIKFHAPSVLRFGYATDASNFEFARRLLESREQPDLFALVFILSDVAGHVFWHAYQPELYPQDPDGSARLKEAVPNVYRQLDRWTGEILDRLDDDTTVILLSDHGMAAKRMLPRPGVNPSGDHTPEGILLVSGPGLPQGADLGRREALDLTPTVLALLGLPVARDMAGRIIEEVVPDRSARPDEIESYGDGIGEMPPVGPSPADRSYEERLRSLGYIQ